MYVVQDVIICKKGDDFLQKNLLLEEAYVKYLEHLRFRQYSMHTLHGYEIDLKQLHTFLIIVVNAPIFIDEITTEHLEGFQENLVRKKLAPASINRKMHSIKSLFKWALTKKFLIQDNSLNLLPIKIPQNERHFLTKDALQQFLKHIEHPTVYIVAQFVVHTGLRISECTQLLVKDVSWERRTVTVVNGKGRKSRTVPLNDFIYNRMLHYFTKIRPKNCSSLYFFALERTGCISPQYINARFREASMKVDPQKIITCHILRHTFASNLVVNNIHISVIQKLLGHANVRTTSIYMHTDFHELQQAVNTLNIMEET